MLAAFVVLLRSLRLICGGHRAGQPSTTPHERSIVWVLLAKAWRDWRTALIYQRE
jgi:hypothetical protein